MCAWAAVLVFLDSASIWNLHGKNLDSWYLRPKLHISVVSLEEQDGVPSSEQHDILWRALEPTEENSLIGSSTWEPAGLEDGRSGFGGMFGYYCVVMIVDRERQLMNMCSSRVNSSRKWGEGRDEELPLSLMLNKRKVGFAGVVRRQAVDISP